MASQNLDLTSIMRALAVVEHLSFRRAAEAIGVSQSSISKRVARLEDMLGVALFERHNAGVRVTDAGVRFFQHVRAALRHLDEAIKLAAMSGRVERGALRIGILSSLASGFLPSLLREFSTHHPDIQLIVFECTPAESLVRLREREFDIAFVIGDVVAGDCESVRFWSEQIFIVLPEAHSLGAKDAIKWEDLIDQTLILGQAATCGAIQEHLIQRSSALNQSFNVYSHRVARDMLMHMVALGQGISFTSQATIATLFPGVTFRPLAGAENLLSFSGVWLLRNNNQALRRFISLARVLSTDWQTSNQQASAAPAE